MAFPIRYGDQISLFNGSGNRIFLMNIFGSNIFSTEIAFGFLSGDGLVDDKLFVDEIDSKKNPPQAFETCVFQFQG
jgi:hypothetical protein